MTKPNVVSEAPPGVARNAGVEGVGRRRRTSKRRSRARERKCSEIRQAPATGEGVRGTCATSPGAIRRPEVRRSLPSGLLACSCAQKLLPSGQPRMFLRSKVVTLRAALPVLVAMQSSNIKLTRDLKAEINLRTPRQPPGITDIVPTDCRRPGMKKSPVLWNFPF